MLYVRTSCIHTSYHSKYKCSNAWKMWVVTVAKQDTPHLHIYKALRKGFNMKILVCSFRWTKKSHFVYIENIIEWCIHPIGIIVSIYFWGIKLLCVFVYVKRNVESRSNIFRDVNSFYNCTWWVEGGRWIVRMSSKKKALISQRRRRCGKWWHTG